MDVHFIKINVAVNASGGGQYSAGVLILVNGVKTNPQTVSVNTAYRSEADFVAGNKPVSLSDIPASFSVDSSTAYTETINCTTWADYLIGGLPMFQSRIEAIVGVGNTEIITVTI